MKNKFLKFLNIFTNKNSENLNINRPKIVAKHKLDLHKLIQKEIKKYGDYCDLNHIDVSQLWDMNQLFEGSSFNGDISKWDVSNVQHMAYMFYESKFNGDISNWDTSNVKQMTGMFNKSNFNGDISKWNTSSVSEMNEMFQYSPFNCDISNWDVSKVWNMSRMFAKSKMTHNLSKWIPLKLTQDSNIFDGCDIKTPYWADSEQRKKFIDSYNLKTELNQELSEHVNATPKKRLKI